MFKIQDEIAMSPFNSAAPLWESLKSRFGDGIHRLDELSIPLDEADVELRFVTSHREKIMSSVNVAFQGGVTVPVSGEVLGELEYRRRPGSHFTLGQSNQNFYVGIDLNTVQDYALSLAAVRAERERLSEKYDRDVRQARANITKVESEIAGKMVRLAKTDVGGDAYIRDRRIAQIEDDLSNLYKRLDEYRALISRGKPEKPNTTFYREIHFGGITVLKLRDVVKAVNTEKLRLLKEFGGLPPKPSTVGLSNVVNGIVTWR